MSMKGTLYRLVLTVTLVLLALCSLLRAQPGGESTSPQGGLFIDFDLLTQDPVQLEAPDAMVIVLNAALINIGTEADSYDIIKHLDLPPGWVASFCFEGVCLPPELDSLSAFIDLDPQLRDSISIHIAPNGIIGGGTVDLTVRSTAAPGLVRTLELVGITYGTDILIVDDEPEDYEQYYQAALGDELTTGFWPRCCATLDYADLIHFPTVIWETGDYQPALTLGDRTALTQFLDNGGNLFITGQDIGWSMCDQSSPYYSESACGFFQDYLYAAYEENDSGDRTLSGVTGDAISHGLNIDIAGGDGANNQTSPSVISPIEPARSVFMYDDSRTGAVRVETGTYKAVYFAFGFEAINDEDTRRDIMANILNRFAYDGEKGDVDNNGVINVLDLLKAANIILTVYDPTPDEHWRADFDNNGQINVLDLIGAVNVILGGGR